MHPAQQQPAPSSSSAPWTAEIVRERLVEAFEVDRRLPRDRRQGTGSSWPAAPIHEFADIVHWDAGEQRERVWRSWERSPAAPAEVTRMEEAFGWLRWVPMRERQALEAWAQAAATRRSVSALLAKRGLKRSTFYRQRDNAARRIADKLNREGLTAR
jgi:hypothetical protein